MGGKKTWQKIKYGYDGTIIHNEQRLTKDKSGLLTHVVPARQISPAGGRLFDKLLTGVES